MLVTNANLDKICKLFYEPGEYGLDTETTGLRAYHDDSLFSLILSNGTDSFYFNFHRYTELTELFVLDKWEVFERLSPAFENENSTWYIANAKFDMGMLAREGVFLAGKIKDTEISGRLIYNADFKYGLDALAQRYGKAKSQEVDEYIKKHRLYSWLQAPGKKKKAKQPHYDQVPFNIISAYGETDGEIVRYIGKEQERELAAIGETTPGQKFYNLCENDYQLTKTCFDMERVGIKIDKQYCVVQYSEETCRAQQVAASFTERSGVPFKDSNKVLAEAFTAAGESYPTTEKGNPSFKDEVLAGFTSPLAKLVQDYRDATKKAGTYYGNFLYFADQNDIVHANIRMARTVTGRFSYSDPNLQNIPRNDPDNPDGTQVRKAFIPRPGFFFCMIDYDQQEFRLMLDYAGEMGVIERILGEGLDVHEATAALMGVSRLQAKTINFMLLYGGGAAKLAAALGIEIFQAKALMKRYFSALPRVRSFIYKVREKAESGFIVNWAGRRYHFSDPNFAYKAPNHLIQGGCADIIRHAMNELHAYLAPYRSRMLVQVHDEILFEIHADESDIIPGLKAIMEKTYPYKHIPMECSVDYSTKSWGDKQEWTGQPGSAGE